MRKLYFLLYLISFVGLFTACNGDKKTDNGLKVIYEDQGKGLDNYDVFDLRPYQIPALIYFPGVAAGIGTSSKPQVQHDLGGFKWNISVGQNFNLTIEDWGNDNAFKDKLLALKNQDIFTIDFIQKSDSFAFYKATLKADGLKGSDKVGTAHVTYHVIAMHTINGINYVFRTNKDGTTENVAKMMAKSVLSVEKVSDKPQYLN